SGRGREVVQVRVRAPGVGGCRDSQAGQGEQGGDGEAGCGHDRVTPRRPGAVVRSPGGGARTPRRRRAPPPRGAQPRARAPAPRATGRVGARAPLTTVREDHEIRGTQQSGHACDSEPFPCPPDVPLVTSARSLGHAYVALFAAAYIRPARYDERTSGPDCTPR